MIFTLTRAAPIRHSYKIVVLGGGSGGSAISHRCRKLVPKGQVAVIEPAQEHYYQPGYTLVGCGHFKPAQCLKSMKDVLHPDNVWIKEAAKTISPTENFIELRDGSIVNYDLLIVAVGIEARFDLIEGLTDGLNHENICSIYRVDLAEKTFKSLQSFDKGNAIFTLPNAPLKCLGAGQKICYVADSIFRKRGKRENIHMAYNTYQPFIFDVPKYAERLNEVLKEKDIELKTLRNLKSINIEKREAIFEHLTMDALPTGEIETQTFDFIHVVPPCMPPAVLTQSSPMLTNAKCFLDINDRSLQHKKFKNIFGIGDCVSSPNKKTAAAVYDQMRTLSKNIPRFLANKPMLETYNCYGACPILVSHYRVMLAEFDANGPLETMPINQAKPRYISYLLKRYIMPFLYWNFGTKGHWLGPKGVRKFLHLGFSK